ncbi:MAG TPA: kelch repeat-containing protein, partial [Bryobacteraceae bacterium]|nr:kelch repeat-containing protein [Bryobacteraceae bacterium]
MCQANNYHDWYILTPDQSGNYVNGTWTQAASLPSGYDPDAFSSAVLADGRLVVVGGEYNYGTFVLTNKAAIYDPVQNSWTALGHPSGWANIGDSPSVVLPNGYFLIGDKLTTSMAFLNPATLTWKVVGSTGKSDFFAEEGWTLMPDGTILTADVLNEPNSERYSPSTQSWASQGSTIVDLAAPSTSGPISYPGGVYDPPGEIGPAILRPDGTVFATGASNSGPAHTAVYHPGPTSTSEGTWTVGPDFPNSDSAGDSSAALLTNGNVLVLGVRGTLYEFDGTNLTATLRPARAGYLMVLPTGQVILTGGSIQVYNSTGTYSPSWAPAITSYPSTVARGTTYTISGKQFNGLSQAAAVGDEFQTATNYPLVRITNTGTGHVFYARTHNHSSMGVATGNK